MEVDENAVAASIAAYKDQFCQIDVLIAADSDDDSVAALRQLQSDLQALIAIHEGSLLDLRKSRILRTLEHVEASSVTNSDTLSEDSRCREEEEGESDAPETSTAALVDDSLSAPSTSDYLETTDGDVDDDGAALVGQKCSVPRRSDCGALLRQNAMIMDVDAGGTGEATVMLCNPTRLADVPCRFYLADRCDRSSAGACRYSHGLRVPLSDVGDFREPRFELVASCRHCFAHAGDSSDHGLWRKATVLHVDFDAATCDVRFLDDGTETAVEHVETLIFCVPHL